MKIGIVVAMQKELTHLLDIAGEYEMTEVLGCPVYTFAKHSNVIIIQSGVGEIQAAMACAILLSVHRVNRVINYGYVGALSDDLRKGDIVNIENVVHCDMDLTVFGKKPGQYEELSTVGFIADSKYFDNATRIKKNLSSSDRFLEPGEERDRQTALFGKNVMDMEGAGIAVICSKAGIPFSMLKCVSNATNDTHEEYDKFSKGGIAYCAELIYKTAFCGE